MSYEFKRRLEKDLIEKLKQEPLWKKLELDCRGGDVYLAIRDGYISFYHKGGNLFKFGNNAFTTHIKYAMVIDTDDDAPKNYVCEDQLKEIPLIRNFVDGYSGIKKNCELYSGLEAKGIANLYHKDSYFKRKSIFVLDIEVAFKKGDGKQERIDILLYDNDSQTLRFVEAKLFSNSALWSTSTPLVVEQMKGYEERINLHKDDLIKEYGQYIDGLRQIFGVELNAPKNLDPKVSLLIFGFDDAQKKSDRFKDLIKDNPEYNNIPIYCKGDPKDLLPETLWKEAK